MPRPANSRNPATSPTVVSEAVDDPAWVDAPGLDSIHTVWFELHEHLLASLGRSRVDER